MKLVDIEPYKGKVIASHTYCGVNKLIEVDALEEISEQEIVKPYLDKIRAEIDKIHEREGSSFDCLNALDELKEFIDRCKAESEDKE